MKQEASSCVSHESGPGSDPAEGQFLTGIGGRSSTAWCAGGASRARSGRSFRPQLPALRQPSSVRWSRAPRGSRSTGARTFPSARTTFPQGSLAPSARAGSDPEPGKRGGKSRPIPGRPSGGWRGVAPSPVLRANEENGERMICPKGNGDSDFREPRCVREVARAAAKGGYGPFAAKCRPRNLRNGRAKRAPSVDAGWASSSTA